MNAVQWFINENPATQISLLLSLSMPTLLFAVSQLLKWWLVTDMVVLWTAGLWVSLCSYCEFP